MPADGRLTRSGTFDESVLTSRHCQSPEARRGHPQWRSERRPPPPDAGHRRAEQSTYAGVIRLVTQAQAAAAPFVRMADRLAFWFVPWRWP